MPEHRELPLIRWGEELRRRRLARRAGRRRFGAAAAAVVALFGTMLWPPVPLLVWNGTASSPVGLYRVMAADRVGPGEMVVAWAPDEARRLAAERGYVPLTVPLVKQVAAAAGDHVCAAGEALFVNGRFAALRWREDLEGRPLPWWTGCKRLGHGELLLLMRRAAESFDGRYFGPIEQRHLIGRARLLWAA